MAKEKQMIVIKKITVVAGGHHGGAWKVAFADFMTAMMAFFLVMWLLSQSSETKKAVSDYFSTPSIIEYNFQNFGAEITLEKLFLDILNEPMKAFQQFLEPADKTPNLMDMGSAKVVAAFMADKLSDVAKNIEVSQDGFLFDIPDTYLFNRGTAVPSPKFIEIMDRLTGVTTGLTDSTIKVTSMMFAQAVPSQNVDDATLVAKERLDIVTNKISSTLENTSVTVEGNQLIREKKGEIDPNRLIGFVRVEVRQKAVSSSGKKSRKLETLFGDPKSNMEIYQNIKNKHAAEKANGGSPEAVNDVQKQLNDELGVKPNVNEHEEH